MRKLFSLLLVLLACATIALAQGPKIVKSAGFDEPDDGWNKVLLLKNGNTFFFNFSKSDGLQIKVYDKDRKYKGTKEITSNLWESKKMKATLVSGLFEVTNEVVLFLTQSEGRSPVCYRLRINSTTGRLIREDEVGELPKIKMFSGIALGPIVVHTSSMESSGIFVEKDPESDCYAVILFNGQGRDLDERIRVLHFDTNHKLIHNVPYDCPSEDFKMLRYIGAVVDGNKRVIMGVYGAGSVKGRDGQVFLARLNASDKKFTNKELDFTEDFKDTKSVMTYNRPDNTIQMLTMTYSGSSTSFWGNGKIKYNTLLSYIDPETLGIKSVQPVAGQKINDYAQNTLKTDLNFSGLPQNMVLNKDKSTTILSEQLTWFEQTHGRQTYTYTIMGAIGVNEINPDGSEKSGYAIIKRQRHEGYLSPLYLSSRAKGIWSYSHIINLGFKTEDQNSYMSYDYINTNNNRYIIFNDDDRNFDKDEDDEKRKLAMKVSRMNTVCYSLNGSTVNKFYLFGDPGDKDESNVCHIQASDYDAATDTYATIMVERQGRDKTAKLVWVTFD